MIRQKIVVEAYKHILQLLRPVKNLAYHNIGHTLDVFRRATELGVSEKLNDEDLADLLIGALFHDAGFIENYNKNEEIGARIAREWLEERGHPEERIQKVEGIIMATVLFSTPNNILEEIIQDADLDNLGRNDCFKKMEKVEQELKSMGNLDPVKFYLGFRQILARHRFNTKTAILERQAKKAQNIEHFETMLKDVVGTV